MKSNAVSVSHLHWLGKKWIAARTNDAPFMAIWNLPESVKLEAQTLDKLSTAPWRLLRGETNAANTASARLRPLLDDLVQEESYTEVRQPTDQPAQIVFAIRLDDNRAALWETNLAAVMESLTTLRTVPATNGLRGWSLKKHDAPKLIELTRAGQWTVVGAASDTNALLGEIIARIDQEHSPIRLKRAPTDPPLTPPKRGTIHPAQLPSLEGQGVGSGTRFADSGSGSRSLPATNHWLDANVDLATITKLFVPDWKPPGNTPRVTLRATPDGQSVRTEGDLIFPKPVTLEFDAWSIPTNLIGEPLVGFTAVRGLRPWLASSESLRGLFTAPPPNQVFLWTIPGLPAQTYFAAPMTDASNQVHALSARLMDAVNPLLATTDNGKFGWAENQNGVTAKGIPFLSPFFRSYSTNGVDYAFGGTVPPYPILEAPSYDMVKLVSPWTNLVYLDWEITGDRIVTWLYLGQLVRYISKTPQIPSDSAAILWTKTLETKLGACDTMVTSPEPDKLHFLRKSTIGFSALELHFLADWLESPQFPRGLHTFLAPPPVPPDAMPQPAATPTKP
ncbi:MAG: hypothetical protein HY298_00845 [Verrucomicrobia bacterium]|nr:hypothetical protein [Verrucomicrobiota bacterium]